MRYEPNHSTVTLFVIASMSDNTSRLGNDVIQPKYEVNSLNHDDCHQCESHGASPGHICWIIKEITQPLLFSSEREPLRGKSDDTSLTRIWRNLSEIRGKITQPWWWSSIGGIRCCISRPYQLDNKRNTSQNYSTVTLFIRGWTP